MSSVTSTLSSGLTRKEGDQIVLASNPSVADRLFCDRAYFVIPEGHTLRGFVHSGGLMVAVSDASKPGSTVIRGIDAHGNCIWSHTLPDGSYTAFGLSADADLAFVRSTPTKLLKINTASGHVETVPVGDVPMPQGRLEWIGSSRFVAPIGTALEVWRVDDRLHRECVLTFEEQLMDFRIDSLSEAEIALVHMQSPIWYTVDVDARKIRRKELNSGTLASMRKLAAQSQYRDRIAVNKATGGDREGRVHIVGGVIASHDDAVHPGGYPMITVNADGSEVETTLQAPTVNGIVCSPRKIFSRPGEVGILTLPGMIAWYKKVA